MGESLTGLESNLWSRGPLWQVVTVCVLRGSLSASQVAAHLSSRLTYAPRWRRVVRPGLLGSRWLDDQEFDVSRHVTEHVATDLSTLPNIVTSVLGTPLPTDRPAWEAVVVSGGKRRTAVILRSSPALVDGYENIHLLQEALDDFPTPIETQTSAWVPEPEPTSDIAADAFTALVRGIRQPRSVLSAAQSGVNLAAEHVAHTLHPRTSVTQHVGSVQFEWDRIRRVRARHQVTAHDVVVSIVTGGYSRWLQAQGDAVTDKVAQIPLGTREADSLGSAIGSRVAPQWMALPVHTTDPVEQLGVIASLTRARIDSKVLVPARELESLAGFAPPTIASVAAGTVAAGRPFDILVTNIPGPRSTRHFGPHQMSACHHLISAPWQGVVTATITSYDNVASIDVVVPEASGAFVEGIRHTMSALESS